MQEISSDKVLLHGQFVPACLRLKDGKIAEITPGKRAANHFGDRLITPAFVNAHTHLALNAWRGFDTANHGLGDARGNMVESFFYRVESSLTEADVRAFARMGAYESLLHGVGFVWDHYYYSKAVAQAMIEVGLSGVVAPTLQDIEGPATKITHNNKPLWEHSFVETMEIARSESHRTAGIFAALGPHATDTVSADLWKRIVDIADSEKLPIHAHLAQSVEEFRRAQQRHQKSPLQFIESLDVLTQRCVFAHGLYLSRADLRQLSEKHTMVFCPYSALVFGFPARTQEWDDAGVSWVVATDCAASNDSMNVAKELRFIAGTPTNKATHSSAYDRFLSEGTLAAAESQWEVRQTLMDGKGRDAPACLSKVWSQADLHPDVSVGTLKVGALANFVIWNATHPALWPGDPLQGVAFADASLAIHAMYVSGKQVGVAGDFHRSLVDSDAYRDAQREASERLLGLVNRISA